MTSVDHGGRRYSVHSAVIQLLRIEFHVMHIYVPVVSVTYVSPNIFLACFIKKEIMY